MSSFLPQENGVQISVVYLMSGGEEDGGWGCLKAHRHRHTGIGTGAGISTGAGTCKGVGAA
jgi:hypothetical protein